MNIRFLKNSVATFIFISLPLILCNTAYALTDSEMQAAVASQGKEAVSGNVFIWFLCAVAFLKISQKIDSFMSGLGVNVGHTGGSMMTEALIAARSLGIGGRGLLNKGFGGGSSSGGGSGDKGGFLSGGLAGVVGRNINNSAMNAATDRGGGLFGKKAFESSLKNGGDFAKDVIGKVAKGDMSKTGSITGETANKALGAYLGYDSAAPELAAINGDTAVMPVDTSAIDTSPDNLLPTETADSPGVGVQPETTAVSGTDGESIPVTAQGSEPSISTPGEIPMDSITETGSNPEIPETDNPSEMQPEISTAYGGEPAVMLDTDAGPGIGVQPETNKTGGLATESGPEPKSSADNPAEMPLDRLQTGGAAMPLSDIPDGMPELPEIIPDYDSAEDRAHPVTVMPDEPNSIPGYSTAGESENILGNIPASADGANTSVQPSIVGGVTTAADSPVHVSQPATSQPASTSPAQPAEVQGGAAPVVTSSGPSVSSSNSQAQSNTVVNKPSNTVSTSAEVSSSNLITQQEHINSPVSMPADSPESVPVSSGGGNIDNQAYSIDGNGLTQNAGSIPVFSNVEIGGGRIMGTETSDKFPSGIEFGMYNTAQYMKPEGEFATVKTVDGEKWYKQYAGPKVEKTPIVEGNGKIKYEEKIVNKLPPVPRRKDRV